MRSLQRVQLRTGAGAASARLAVTACSHSPLTRCSLFVDHGSWLRGVLRNQAAEKPPTSSNQFATWAASGYVSLRCCCFQLMGREGARVMRPSTGQTVAGCAAAEYSTCQ